MAKIIGVGNATVDIISYLDGYPLEDTEQRADSRVVLRGGNVANSLVVLSQLGHQCTWSGTLARDHFATIITDEFSKYSVNYKTASWHENAHTPLSCITVNSQNGSRTIVHERQLPEYTVESFQQNNFDGCAWVHFEGRNIEQIRLMVNILRQQPECPLISLEVEKHRDKIQDLYESVDLVLFSSDYVLNHARQQPDQFLKRQYKSGVHRAMYCAQGSEGAWGIDDTGVCFVESLKLDKVYDTTGAGDVFNAAIIHANLEKYDLNKQLSFACELAAKKCMLGGFDLPV